MATLRIALFVEGSVAPVPPRGPRPLERIWNEHIAAALGFPPFEHIIPISKKNLVAMDPAKPRMSGAGEALDKLMVRVASSRPFDAAVVAWDLVPAWNSDGQFCRREETLNLYRLLADSDVLLGPWKAEAHRRHQELSTRPPNNAGVGPPHLRANAVVAVCMEPMFEGLLVQDENAVRRALGLAGTQSPRGWPGAGWGAPPTKPPDSGLLVPAIGSLRSVRPKARVTKLVTGDFRTNKDGWGEYLLRQLLADPRARPAVLGHPICARLQNWLR